MGLLPIYSCIFFSVGDDFRRQNLTVSKVDPRAEGVMWNIMLSY